jgi:methionyl-tRNA synthetase
LVKHAPWALAKDPAQRPRQGAVLRGAAEALLQVAAMASPAMPVACAEIASRLSATIPDDLSNFRWGLLPAAAAVRRGDPQFARVDKAAYFSQETTTVDPKTQNDVPLPASTPGPAAERAPAVAAAHLAPGPATTPGPNPPAAPAGVPVPAGLLSIDDFMKVELRVALVLTAERVAGADKLLRLEVDLGTEKRQIVAGIAKAYSPEQLVGKRIVVVANLKPAKLRGIESQGMLLAADAGGRPIVATFDEDVVPGTRVR